MLLAPLVAWCTVEVNERRTQVDWVRVRRKPVDEDYAGKDGIVRVLDHLNTHHPTSLYEAFEPAEARRVAERIQIHFATKHRNSLNMSEFEVGVEVSPILGPSHSRPRCPGAGGESVAASAQQERNEGRIAFPNRRQRHQPEGPLSINLTLMVCWA